MPTGTAPFTCRAIPDRVRPALRYFSGRPTPTMANHPALRPPPALADQWAADLLVHLRDVGRRGGAACADRPDRLVGDDEAARLHAHGDGALHLARDHRQGLLGVALLLGLADADDGHQPGAERRLGLGAHLRIGLVVVGAPLGMADDDVAAADVAQHPRGGVAGVRARPGAVAVLAAEGDARSEEHTSELQSLMRISYAVFCLKKTKRK